MSPVYDSRFPAVKPSLAGQTFAARGGEGGAPPSPPRAANVWPARQRQALAGESLAISRLWWPIGETRSGRPTPDTRCMSASTRCMSASTRCMSGSTRCMSASTRCMSASTRCMSASTRCMSGSTRCMSGSTRCMSASTRCMSASTRCMSAVPEPCRRYPNHVGSTRTFRSTLT